MSVALLLLPVLVAAPTERSVLAELERYDRGLSQAEVRLRRVSEQRRELLGELATIDAERATAKLRAERAQQHFQRRLRALARMPAGARFAVISGTTTLADYLRAKQVLRRIATHDRKLHQQHLSQSNRLEQLRRAAEERNAKVSQLEAEARQHRDSLAQHRQGRLAVLQSIQREQGVARRAAVERRAAADALGRKVRKLQPLGRTRDRFGGNKGRLPWPAAGTVRVGYGQRVELDYGTVTSHNGLDISAKAGDPVRAVAGGRVVFADWLKGYGRVVIVDHGDSYHSLVAHLSAIQVAVGEGVRQGDALGSAGDTGSLRGTVLYFEIRHHGKPVDPRRWLRPG